MKVIYYERRGKAPVAEYLATVYESGQESVVASFEHVLRLVMELGTSAGMPTTRIIDRRRRIWELRFAGHRVAYIVEDGTLVLLHGWPKKSQKLDALEAATAARHAEDWRKQYGR